MRRTLGLALIRTQIALGALALRAGFDLGMFEGPPLARPDRRADFDGLLEDLRDGFVDYRLDTPKHEFLSYLVHVRGFLLHGTASRDLAELQPTPAMDHGARSVVQVSAASDGIWPLFFATLDRERAGDIWNGCLHVRRGGSLRRFYFFFTDADPSDERVWRNGTVYVLPRDGFARTWIPNEWACERPVRPVAKLAVSPSDFPFRLQVMQLDRRLSPMGNLRRLRATKAGTA